MATGIKEIHFEEHIEQELILSGFESKPSSEYDKELCLIPNDLISFIEDTQPEAYKALAIQYGSKAYERIVYNISQYIKKHGVVNAFRKKIKDRGQDLVLYYPPPGNKSNPDHIKKYKQNRFSVIRQLKYSKNNENSIDLVLFLNGIPIITAELKNALTGQYLSDAIHQYKYDRDPAEPLLSYKCCMVHFAVSTEKASMTTKLAKENTRFFPFNKGIDNPVVKNGFQTEYLWKEIWQKESIAKLIQHFVHFQKNTEKYYDSSTRSVKEKSYEVMVFPRFHQLRSVTRILGDLKVEGVGTNYLVQHSAGSGKSNSIGWLAHQLSGFFQKSDDDTPLFNSTIVITDRKVLDRQLQDTITQLEQVPGVVETIDDKKTSQDLKNAIEAGRKVIVTTLQKFPVISESVSHFKDRRFAVIIDEAHSSQTGESARHLRKALSLEEAEDDDQEPKSLDDIVLDELSKKGRQENISFFAFTATPKNRTLELFGTMRNGVLQPFDVYSMEQAIREGFILDVLQSYTSFRRYYKLSKRPDVDDKEYDIRKTVRLLNSYVDLQDHAIDMKSRIMLEHFVSKTQQEISGKARAMLVTRSRLHAVRYKRKFDDLMQEMKLPNKSLVAFSGTVYDETTDDNYTESSMNNLGGKISIEDAFKLPQNRILIVANKFQTGFDEPMLHTMFVDKRLGGVNTVQTLSRLNRTAKGKRSTMVLDFVNDPEEVREDFQDYYNASFMEEGNQTDPNLLYEIITDLDIRMVYSIQDIERFSEIFFTDKNHMEKVQPILNHCAERFKELNQDDQFDFRSKAHDFVRLYRFLSQIITFKDIDLEKYYVFLAHFIKKIPFERESLPIEVINEVELANYKIQREFTTSLTLEPGGGELTGQSGSGTASAKEENIDLLSNIVKTLNDTYGANLSDENKQDLEKIWDDLLEDEGLMAFFNANNSKDDIKNKFFGIVDDSLLDFVNDKLELYNKISEDKVNGTLKRLWFNQIYDQKVLGIS